MHGRPPKGRRASARCRASTRTPRQPRARLVVRHRQHTRPGSDADRHQRRALHERQLSVVFAIDARTGKQLWKWDPGGPARCRGEGLLRCRQPRCRRASRPRLRRHARWAARVARCRAAQTDRDRRPDAELHHHRRPARRQEQGDCRKTAANTACAATCRPTTRTPASWRGDSTPSLESPLEASSLRRWSAPRRRGVANGGSGGGGTGDSLTYDPELDLLFVGTGNGSPWSQRPAPLAAATTCTLVDPRAAARHRRAGVALPDNAGRNLGLHRDAAHDPGRSHDCWPGAEGADAGHRRTGSSTCSIGRPVS